MHEAQSLLYVAAIALCVFSIGLISKKRQDRSRTFIIGFLGVEAVCFLFEWLMVYPYSPFKALWLGGLMTTSFLSAPLLWLAVRERFEVAPVRMQTLHKGHYIVVLAGLLLCMPLLSSAHSGVNFANPEQVTGKAYSLFIHATMLICIIVYCFQVPFYLLRIYKISVSHSESNPALNTSQSDALLASVRFFILILCSAWLLGVLRTVHCIVPGESSLLQLMFSLVDVGITVGVLYVVLSQGAQEAPANAEPAKESPRYQKSALDQNSRTRILQKLTHAMEQELLYCDNLLSLRSLSTHIKENPHYVSQVLNQELDTNFYRFINAYRIEHAKRELLDHPQRNVLEIALQVGFNSKSTFNTAFRALTHTTPSRYRGK